MKNNKNGWRERFEIQLQESVGATYDIDTILNNLLPGEVKEEVFSFIENELEEAEIRARIKVLEEFINRSVVTKEDCIKIKEELKDQLNYV